MPVIVDESHRFFDSVVTFLCSYTALVVGASFYATGRQIAPSSGFKISFVSASSAPRRALHFYPYETLRIVYSGAWPNSVDLREGLPDRVLPMSTQLNGQGIHQINGRLTEAMYVHYYETVSPLVDAKHAKGIAWPSVWRFGRAIRNAFVHNGCILIRDPNEMVSWRQWTYGQRDNGRSILFSDLATFEIIHLMMEMDAAV